MPEQPRSEDALTALTSHLGHHCPEVFQRLMDGGSWRGLFDPYSAEFKKSRLHEKVELLADMVRETRLTVTEMIHHFQVYHNSKGRPDIARAADDVALDLLNSAVIEVARLRAGVNWKAFDALEIKAKLTTDERRELMKKTIHRVRESVMLRHATKGPLSVSFMESIMPMPDETTREMYVILWASTNRSVPWPHESDVNPNVLAKFEDGNHKSALFMYGLDKKGEATACFERVSQGMEETP